MVTKQLGNDDRRREIEEEAETDETVAANLESNQEFNLIWRAMRRLRYGQSALTKELKDHMKDEGDTIKNLDARTAKWEEAQKKMDEQMIQIKTEVRILLPVAMTILGGLLVAILGIFLRG